MRSDASGASAKTSARSRDAKNTGCLPALVGRPHDVVPRGRLENPRDDARSHERAVDRDEHDVVCRVGLAPTELERAGPAEMGEGFRTTRAPPRSASAAIASSGGITATMSAIPTFLNVETRIASAVSPPRSRSAFGLPIRVDAPAARMIAESWEEVRGAAALTRL